MNQLRRAIKYICNPTKTREELIGGVGVNASNALKRMEVVKNFYGKPDGREYIHFCVSFSGKPNEETVFEIAYEIAKYYRAFQVLYAVHLNTRNTHIHFIINTVCAIDGHKFSQSRSDLEHLKDYIDEIVSRYPDLYYTLNDSEDFMDDEYSDFLYDIYDDENTESYSVSNDYMDDEDLNDYPYEESDFYFEDRGGGVFQLKAVEAPPNLIEPIIFSTPSEKVLPSIIVPFDSETFQST